MKKAIYHGIRNITVEEVPDTAPGPGEVKVKIRYCGICGTDLHEYLHGPFPESPFGHEACGNIAATGPDVTGYAVGDRVCAVTPGAFSEAVICPTNRLFKIPEKMDWKRAAVLEPLSGAAYALDRGQVKPSDTVFIAGAGTVGLMLLLGLKATGVQTVFMTDVLENRRKKAKELGATMAWNPDEIKSPARIKELTNGRGADLSIEAVGIEATLKDCLAAARYQGTVIVQGIFTARAGINMLGFVSRETTMIGTNSINPALAMKWLETGNIRPEGIITDIISLSDIVKGGFDVLAGKSKTAIKILVEP
ncbi:MAG: zinc-binding dehydrogenase [Deltaproteobacteria bacterium]|nr:zinc-binding dehydrogenase [Deltaproteobacteria bacterium]